MPILLGYTPFGNDSYFSSPIAPINNFTYIQGQNCILDEVSVRSNIEQDYIAANIFDYQFNEGTLNNTNILNNSLILDYTSAWNSTSGSDSSTGLDSSTSFYDTSDASVLFDNFFGAHFNYYASSGTRISPIFKLSDYAIITNLKNSTITWSATTPTNTSLTIQVNYSLDNGDTWSGWNTCTNGGSILPAYMIGYDLSDLQIQIKISMTTTDPTITPQLNSIKLYFQDNNLINKPINNHDPWYMDTRLLAQFNGSLDAGNIWSNGLTISKFAITRRKNTDTNSITLGYVTFVNNKQMTYVDTTQANEKYVYTLYPVFNNGLWGAPNSVTIQSNFAGWWILDKSDLTQYIECDQYAAGNSKNGEVDITVQLKQSVKVIETLGQYPHIYKFGESNYHTFKLNALLIGDSSSSSFNKYQTLLKMANSNKPFVVKSGNGDLYFATITDVQKKSSQISWRDVDNNNIRDILEVTITLTETMSEEQYHQIY